MRNSNAMPAAPKLPGFTKKQYEFTAYIRDPVKNPLPSDIEARRINLYRELIFNNVEGFLADSFPVLRRLLDDRRWGALVQDYFSQHKAQTPYFVEISEEFINYLQIERGEQPGDLPFMLELAHYEWVESALAVAQGQAPDQIDATKLDFTAGIYTLSPVAWPLAYQYPVHQITREFQPSEPPEQQTYLVVYRDTSDSVKFLQVNPATFRLLQLLEDNSETAVDTILSVIANELPQLDCRIVIEGGHEALAMLNDRSLLAEVDRET